LIIALHGNGGNSDSYAQVADYFTENNFIFASPQGPYLKAQSNGKLDARYSWEIQISDTEVWKKGVAFTENYVLNVVNYFKSNYKIKNVYLFGFSQGAAFTYIIGIKQYEQFEGIIVLGGRLLPTDEDYSVITDEEILKAKNLNVFIGHGMKDNIIELKYAKSAKARLKKAGYNVTFYTYDEGHILTLPLIQEVIKWILVSENE
jgi:phospholipase/carboxylesterase